MNLPKSSTTVESLWNTTFRQLRLGLSLDDNYNKVVLEINKHVQLLQRHHRVRIKQWLEKLDLKTCNVTWKRNRNRYARLLLNQLRVGCLGEPFHQPPLCGGLPTFPRWTSPILLRAARSHKTPACKDGYGSDPKTQVRAAELIATAGDCRAMVSLHSGGPEKSAEDSLAAYVKQQGTVQSLLAKQRPRLQLRCQDLTSGDRRASARGSRAATHDQGAALRGEGGHMWQASKLELVAALGAAREKGVELAWRLARAEKKLAEQEEHGGRRHRLGREELDKLILDFEARQAGWRSPQQEKACERTWSEHEAAVSQEFRAFGDHTAALRQRLEAAAERDKGFLVPQGAEPPLLLREPPRLDLPASPPLLPRKWDRVPSGPLVGPAPTWAPLGRKLFSNAPLHKHAPGQCEPSAYAEVAIAQHPGPPNTGYPIRDPGPLELRGEPGTAPGDRRGAVHSERLPQGLAAPASLPSPARGSNQAQALIPSPAMGINHVQTLIPSPAMGSNHAQAPMPSNRIEGIATSFNSRDEVVTSSLKEASHILPSMPHAPQPEPFRLHSEPDGPNGLQSSYDALVLGPYRLQPEPFRLHSEPDRLQSSNDALVSGLYKLQSKQFSTAI
eukprot:jgi/Botrbrau1/13534/Bobra.0347s0018.1